MLSERQIKALNRRFPLIGADAGLVRELAANTAATTLESGHNICHEGDRCSHLALITAGSARVYKLAESGREITLYRVEPGECCILTASCMLSGRTFPANATTDSELDAVLIPQSQVLRWMKNHETWQHYLWGLLAERLGDSARA
jgi:CRP/FNR family transcriptional regulator